jgi:hypothetical protein
MEDFDQKTWSIETALEAGVDESECEVNSEWGCGLDSSGSRYYSVASSNQYVNDPSNSGNCDEFNGQLSDSRILMKLVG